MSVSSMKYSRDVYMHTIIDTANLTRDNGTAFVLGDDCKRARHSMLTSGRRVLWKSNAFWGESVVRSCAIQMENGSFFPNIVSYNDGKHPRRTKIK